MGIAKPELKAEVVRLRVEERLSLREIVSQTGASQGSVSLWLKELPLTPSEVGERRQRGRAILPRWTVTQAYEFSSLGTNEKGQIAQLKVELRAAEKGAVVCRPVAAHVRYDLVIEWENKLYRAQVKWANRVQGGSDGSVSVTLNKITRGNKVSKPCYTSDEIDVLVVYLPRTDQVLWIPAELFHGRGSLTFRTHPTRNGQSQGVHTANEFVW